MEWGSCLPVAISRHHLSLDFFYTLLPWKTRVRHRKMPAAVLGWGGGGGGKTFLKKSMTT